MIETNFLSPDDLKLWSLPDGAMVLKTSAGKRVLGAPRRALPLSEPERFIVLTDADGAEVGVVRDIGELDEDSQRVLREALAQAYKMVRITRILEVEREPISGQTRWRVEVESPEGEIEDELPAPEAEPSRTLPVVPAVKKLLKRNDDNHDAEEQSRRVGAHEREFHIAGPEDVQTARYPHIYIVDTDRNRYEIPNCEALDVDSRRAADRFF